MERSLCRPGGVVDAGNDLDREEDRSTDRRSGLGVERKWVVDSGRTGYATVAVTGDGVSMDPREGYVAWGTRGSLAYADKRLYLEHKGATRYPIEEGIVTDHDAITRAKMRHFVDAIAGRAQSLATGVEAAQVVALTEAAYLADERGTSIDVQELLSNAEARLSRT